MRSRFSWPTVALAALLVIVGGVYLRNAAMLAEILFFPERVIELPRLILEPDLTVTTAGDLWKKLGVKEGDRLRSIDGELVHSSAQAGRFIFGHRAGETIRAVFERSGEAAPLAVEGRLAPIRNGSYPWQEVAWTIYVALLFPALCMAVGFFVAFRRPHDPVAWWLLAMIYSVARISVSFQSHKQGWSPWFTVPDVFFERLPLLPLAVYWFGLLFPDRTSPYKLLPWLRWPITIGFGGFTLLYGVADTGVRHAPEFFGGLRNITERLIGQWVNWMAYGMLLLGLANLVYKMIREKQPSSRRRMKLLVAGLAAGALPLAALLTYGGFKGKDALVLGEPTLIVALVALTLVPVTLAYVVLVHKAMDVGVAMRRGLRYGLASVGVRAGGILFALLCIVPLVIYAQRKETPDGMRVLAVAGILGTIFVMRWLRGRLKTWVDRRFHRESVDSERLIAELSDQLHRIVDPKALLDTVTRQIAETFHVPRVAALLEHDGGAFRPALAHGYGAHPPAVEFNGSSAAITRLREDRSPLTCYLDDPDHWIHREAPEDTARLRQLQAELLLPISARDRLMGFLSLGPKRSEEPYSRSDLRLLQSLASQTGLALENSRLARAIAEEATQRERLHREIEIAREVQERLFPKRAPVVPGLELAGRCLPAQTIGGDYFDFLETPSGQIGLAIADVAGKGIPAALLMAGMQASLRSLTLAGVEDLADLMTKLNRLVYDASPANRFITFFYGLYEPSSGRLRYASAGHNPALLLRADGGVEWLSAKGTGLGLARKGRYEAGETTLAPGDRLVLYTDGVPEARNAAGDEYGEERMIEASRTETSAEALVERLIQEAAAFAGEAPRHDDITVIAARRPIGCAGDAPPAIISTP